VGDTVRETVRETQWAHSVRGFGGGGMSSRRRFATPAGFLVPREIYSARREVWALSIVQGPFSVASCQTSDDTTIRNSVSSPAARLCR
jgi:hypothetical protein